IRAFGCIRPPGRAGGTRRASPAAVQEAGVAPAAPRRPRRRWAAAPGVRRRRRRGGKLAGAAARAWDRDRGGPHLGAGRQKSVLPRPRRPPDRVGQPRYLGELLRVARAVARTIQLISSRTVLKCNNVPYDPTSDEP